MPPDNKPGPLNEVELTIEESEITRSSKKTVKLKGSEKTEELLEMAAKQLESEK